MQMNTARQLKGKAQGFLGNMSLIPSGGTFLSKKRGKAGKQNSSKQLFIGKDEMEPLCQLAGFDR